MNQLRLPLAIEDRTSETFLVSASNRAAWDALGQWRHWPGGALALSGPPFAGKSHMAGVWAREAGASSLPRDCGADGAVAAFRSARGRLWIDEVDLGFDDAALTLAIDLARAEGGALLLVGRGAPGFWPAQSRDLSSRLAALPVARMGEPDLELLEGVLRRLARARFLELPEPVARYLAQHMERTFAAAHALAEQLDRDVRRGRTPVSFDMARRALIALGGEAPEEDEA